MALDFQCTNCGCNVSTQTKHCPICKTDFSSDAHAIAAKISGHTSGATTRNMAQGFQCSKCGCNVSSQTKQCPVCKADLSSDVHFVGAHASSRTSSTTNKDIGGGSSTFVDVFFGPGVWLGIFLVPFVFIAETLNFPFWLGVVITIIVGILLVINREKLPWA